MVSVSKYFHLFPLSSKRTRFLYNNRSNLSYKMRSVILCLFLINMLHHTYCLLDEESYSEEEFKRPWHRVLGTYGGLIDRAKPLKPTKNENKFFYHNGYGIVGRPYYPDRFVQEYYGHPYYGEMGYQPNGWFSSAIPSYSNYLVRKDKNDL